MSDFIISKKLITKFKMLNHPLDYSLVTLRIILNICLTFYCRYIPDYKSKDLESVIYRFIVTDWCKTMYKIWELWLWNFYETVRFKIFFFNQSITYFPKQFSIESVFKNQSTRPTNFGKKMTISDIYISN